MTSTGRPGCVRIATWNVAYGRGSINDLRRERLAAVDADIWILTETHDSLSPGPEYVPAHADQRPMIHPKIVTGSRWATIWSRVPVLEVVSTADAERTVACLLQVHDARFFVYGTVLPWYRDTDRAGMTAELARQAPEWRQLPHDLGAHACVAGDLNVNLGGPHYYGSNADKAAVGSAIAAASLTPITDFDHTSPLRPDFGLIDHIAVSCALAEEATVAELWEATDTRGRRLSDHAGVAIDIHL